MIIHGGNLIIKRGGIALAMSKSCTIDVQAEIIKVSDATDGQWEHTISGRKSWSVSTNHLVTDFVDMLKKPGNRFSIEMTLQGDDEMILPMASILETTPTVITTEVVPVGSTTKFVYDKLGARFLARNPYGSGYNYYNHWSGGDSRYRNPQEGDLFKLPYGTVYKWENDELTDNPYRMSGYAQCKQCKITATKGNLCAGSFSFEGDGPLY